MRSININEECSVSLEIYSKFSQMADSKMAVLADWRLAFGHPLLTNGGYFPQIGGFSREINCNTGGKFWVYLVFSIVIFGISIEFFVK